MDRTKLLTLTGFAVLLAMLLVVAHGAPAHTLTINVVDDVTGEHLSFRGHCLDAGATARYPLPTSTCLKHDASSTWPVWWYADSPCTLSIPAGGEGTVTVGAGCGFEYRPDTLVVSVTADTEVTLRLTPLTDMSSIGWYSGDTAADITHGPVEYTLTSADAFWASECEGLDVFNSEGSTTTGTPETDGDRIFYAVYEMRHKRYGHFAPLGATATPDSTIWAQNLSPCIYDLADTVANRGPSPNMLIVVNHPSEYQPTYRETDTPAGTMWPREVMVDALYGKIDAYDIMWNADGYTPTRYFHMLNTGAILPVTGGTDSALSKLASGPPGGVKTYAYATDYDYWHWIEAIRAGRTFATNGPLVTEFTVNGEMPGSTLTFTNLDTETLDVVLEFESGYPVKRVDYLVNGSRVGGKVFTVESTAWDTTDTVTVEHGGAWVAARLIGDDPGWFVMGGTKDSLVAQTSPVYVTMAGLDVNVAASATYLEGWCDSLMLVTDWLEARGTCVWSSGAEEVRVEGIFQAASDAYAAKATQATFIIDPEGGGDYPTIALAIAGDADANDTLILVDDVHDGPGTTAIPIGMTVRSLGPDHRDDCVIKNLSATVQAILIDAGPVYFRDLTFRTFTPYTAGNEAFVQATDLGQGVFDYCRWAYCRNATAGTAPAAIYAVDADALRFFSCEFDSCAATGAGGDYGIGWFEDVEDLVFKDCRFTRNSSVDRAPIFIYHTGNVDTTLFDGNLFYGNSSANYGILRIYDNTATNTNTVDHCTFVDNTCTDASDGPVRFEQAGQVAYLDHCIITGGNGVAVSDTYKPDYARWSNAWDNDGTETLFAGTDSTDCISVDPEYTTTDLATLKPYMAMSVYPESGTSSPRYTADGSYMGWLQPPKHPPDQALMGRLYRRRQ